MKDREGVSGAPGEIRTPDPLLRRQMLYPAELRARSGRWSDSKAFDPVPKIKSSLRTRESIALNSGTVLTPGARDS
jgi:hypothetical protein